MLSLLSQVVRARAGRESRAMVLSHSIRARLLVSAGRPDERSCLHAVTVAPVLIPHELNPDSPELAVLVIAHI